MRLLPDIDEDALVRDIGRIVEAEGGTLPGLGTGEEGAAAAPAEDAALATLAAAGFGDDPFVRGFVRSTAHVRRYLPFYAGALAWLLIVAVLRPFGGASGDGDTRAASTARPPAASAEAETPTTLAGPDPSADAVDAPGLSAEFAGAVFSTDVGEVVGSVEGPAIASSPGSSSTTVVPSFDESVDAGDLGEPPTPLTIVKSGYSSRTGGTPVEQEPAGGGLPVAAAGGEHVKRSFVAVAGDERVLRLAPVTEPGATVGDAGAAIRACAITTEGWTAVRGAAFDSADEPDFGDRCVDGVRGEDGVWSFDLASFGDVEDVPGFALVPAGDPSAPPFHVTFQPTPASS